jgi:hypothetical protein
LDRSSELLEVSAPLCNKLIRILFSIGKKQYEFNEEKMLKDIPGFSLLLLRELCCKRRKKRLKNIYKVSTSFFIFIGHPQTAKSSGGKPLLSDSIFMISTIMNP